MTKEKEESLSILQAAYFCDELQEDKCCTFGNKECIKCFYNIQQGTISQHKKALELAINALEEK